MTREELIQHLLDMKNGTDKTTPQPDQYRWSAKYFNDLLPWCDLYAGLREALKGKSNE